MAYVKNKNGFKVGDWAITTRKVDSCAGYFEKGTKVKVIGKSYRGYDLEDEYGNRLIETGYDSIGLYEKKKNITMNKLETKVILHSKGVAEVMYELASENKEEMYLLGLLHDIGKLRGFTNHEKNGAKVLTNIGLKYSKEVMYHGKIQNEYSSPELDLLNAADLSVDLNGNIVGYKKRIEDIKERYGPNSTEYINAINLSNSLLELLNKVENELSAT